MRYLVLALLFVLAACQSGGVRPEKQYKAVLKELRGEGGTQGLREGGREKLESLYVTIEQWAADGLLASASDKLWAAASLIHAESPERVGLALQLAQQAAMDGEQRAHAIVAQAIDKRALQEGRPQTYGTQYVYHTHPGIWVLYDLDPSTTDEDRAAVGVPPLKELLALVQRLNEQRQDDLLKWADENRAGPPR
ncbi:MAG: hypothetical protein H6829_01675 [Planctomycetes bacterium]|nr:hypothetical protein [Planctomycetota bacterium]HPF13080.1 hypothetical protein [Planctomycetota bacterium]HRV80095.1 hypothetical protein [Planctomycetota bacterium]